MEFVEGSGLDAIIARRGVLPLPVVLPIVRQVLRGLEAAHEVGVVHRDIKPGNILVQPSGAVKVMDFGIARLAERSAGQASLTAAGAVVGSLEYMAPEQLLGEAVDLRVDVYATGCVLYECLTGRRLHEATSIMALIAKQSAKTGGRPQRARRSAIGHRGDRGARAVAGAGSAVARGEGDERGARRSGCWLSSGFWVLGAVLGAAYSCAMQSALPASQAQAQLSAPGTALSTPHPARHRTEPRTQNAKNTSYNA